MVVEVLVVVMAVVVVVVEVVVVVVLVVVARVVAVVVTVIVTMLIVGLGRDRYCSNVFVNAKRHMHSTVSCLTALHTISLYLMSKA